MDSSTKKYLSQNRLTKADIVIKLKDICDAVQLKPTYVTCPFDSLVFASCSQIFSKSAFN